MTGSRQQTSEEEFVKWFQPIVPLEFDGTNLRLRVPNESYVHQIEKNYIPFLRPIISQLYGQQTRLHYAVPRSTPARRTCDRRCRHRRPSRASTTQTDTANIKNPFVIPGAQEGCVIDPQLNPNYTFATFIEGECNRLARSAGHVGGRESGQRRRSTPCIYTAIRDWERPTSHRRSATKYRQRHPELQVLYVSMNKFQAQFQTGAQDAAKFPISSISIR